MNRKVPKWELDRRKISVHPEDYFNVKSCKYCETEFQPKHPAQLYCCDECKGNGTAERHYKNTYGMTLKELYNLMDEQNRVCAICFEEGFQMNNRVYSGLNVDHCHESGTVRGLLCHNYNRALGLLKDDIGRLRQAISYLERATTISKESTPKRVEAQSPSSEGDDIV